MKIVLPTRREQLPRPPIDAKEVTKICLRLKHQIEQIIPYELEVEKVTKANSPIITQAVLNTANKSGGEDRTACVVYCLLIVKKWFSVWNSNREGHVEYTNFSRNKLRLSSGTLTCMRSAPLLPR